MDLCNSDNLDDITVPGNEAAFRALCRICVPAIIGRQSWKNRSTADLLSNYVTIPDEAFAVFLLENAHKKWQAMAEHGLKSNEAKAVPARYTTGTGKNVGWTNESMSRYNELMRKVAESRRSGETREALELTLKKELMGVRGITDMDVENSLVLEEHESRQNKRARVKVDDGFQYASI